MDRRSVIKAVSSIGIVGGTLFSTGAFESVEATRNVNVQTKGDSSALLSLDGSNSNIIKTDTDSSSNTIKIAASDLNEDSITRFSEVLDVTNNGNSDTSLWVDSDNSTVSVGDGSALDIEYSGTSIVTSPPGDGSVPGTAQTIGQGDTESFDLTFNLKDDTSPPSGDLILIAGAKV